MNTLIILAGRAVVIAALLFTIGACGSDNGGNGEDTDAEVDVLEEDGDGDLTVDDGTVDDGAIDDGMIDDGAIDDGMADEGTVEDLDAAADDGAEGDPAEDEEGEGDVVEEDIAADDGEGGCTGCIIAGACFEDGTPAPGNICLVCDADRDTGAWSDNDGASCNDDVFCNGADTCLGGACTVHASDPCADDGLFCTGTESCDETGNVCSSSGDPCPGPDGDDDCSETCDETANGCTANDMNDAACDDGTYCNGIDACQGGDCSTHLGSPCPGPDGDSDCSETCDETSNGCTANDPNASACSDGLYCNGDDTCQGGDCSTHLGSPCPGPDGDSDCSETCDETSNGCTANDPNGSSCFNGSVDSFCLDGTCQ